MGITEMTKDLVQAGITTGMAMTVDEMIHLLRVTHAELMALDTLEKNGPAAQTEPVAVVKDWRRSIRKSTIQCLECGGDFKQIGKRHLGSHDMTPKAYREKYGIPKDVSLASRTTAERRKAAVTRARPWESSPTYQKAHSNGIASHDVVAELVMPEETPAEKPKRVRKSMAKVEA